ncbi:uncharacterized protein LOC119682769 [Teleopsis dalmanni]|uniref:uncharacterized protein LOC119682769 n=1 Tax=Teleopsis dalmanni TaxID=139649 RepID=UPI0018CC91E6|nr:uncharacterized protein LOC119682769 [Teleopsis dalmanni]
MKATILLALLGVLAISANVNGAALDSTPDLNPFDYINYADILKAYLKAFQRIMPCGYAAWNLPPLAPYTVDNWDYDYSGDGYSLVGSFSNLYVEGLNDWQLLDFSYNTTTQEFNYDVLHRKLQILSEYTVNATATIANMPFTYAGEGVLNWKFTDVRSIGGYTFQTNGINQNGIEMTNFRNQVILGDVQANNWNNYWNNEVNNFVNRWLRKYVFLWTEEAQANMGNIINNYLLPAVNRQLADLSMDQFLEILVGLTMELDQVKC